MKKAAARRMTPKRSPKTRPRIPPRPILAVGGGAVTHAIRTWDKERTKIWKIGTKFWKIGTKIWKIGTKLRKQKSTFSFHQGVGSRKYNT